MDRTRITAWAAAIVGAAVITAVFTGIYVASSQPLLTKTEELPLTWSPPRGGDADVPTVTVFPDGTAEIVELPVGPTETDPRGVPCTRPEATFTGHAQWRMHDTSFVELVTPSGSMIIQPDLLRFDGVTYESVYGRLCDADPLLFIGH